MANQTIYNCILERIRVAEPESVFVSTDYVDLADVNTVRQCLSRMEQTGELQRIMRGVYYRPVFSQLLGEYEGSVAPSRGTGLGPEVQLEHCTLRRHRTEPAGPIYAGPRQVVLYLRRPLPQVQCGQVGVRV